MICQDSSLSIRKISLDLTSLIWSYTLPAGNQYTGVDITVYDGVIYLALNTYLKDISTIPNLISTTHPRNSTYQGMVVEISDRTGRVISSNWVGSCMQGNSKVNSVDRYMGNVYLGGLDDCEYGNIWIEKYKGWILSENGEAKRVKISVIRLRVYVGVERQEEILLGRYESNGARTWIKTITKGVLDGIKASELSNLITLEYILISSKDNFYLYNQDGSLIWKLSLQSDLTLTSILPFSLGYILTGTLYSSSLGYSLPSSTQSGIALWLNFSGNLLSSRLYNSSSSVLIISTLPIYEADLLFLLNSKESFFTNSNTSNTQSALLFISRSIFSLSTCHSLCFSCFGASSSECYECTNYFIDTLSCGGCGKYCKYCKSLNECRQCESGYKNMNGECVVDIECKVGEYIDKNSSSCKICHSSCKSCRGGLETECEECNENRYRNDSYCVSECPSFRFGRDGACVDCHNSCERCIEATENDCTACKKSLVLYKGKCQTTCPEGTYLDQGECKECNKACKTCKGPGLDCTDCNINYFRFNKDCIRECPEGYYKSDKGCEQCKEYCKECIGLNTCIQCIPGYYVKNGECLPAPECDNGMYFDGNECIECEERCKECYGGRVSECYECQEGYFLIGDSCETLEKKCELGKYRNNVNECSICKRECKACKNEQECTECNEGYYLLDKVCTNTCPTSYRAYLSICEPCPTGCKECEFECISCNEGYLLLEGECVTTCPLNMYISNNTCTQCEDFCAQCSSQGSCVLCEPGYFLSDFTCIQCSSTCSDCISFTQCTGCNDNFLLFNSSCMLSCPPGTYNSTGICKSCPNNCSSCTQSECLDCIWDQDLSGKLSLLDGMCTDEPICMPGEEIMNKKCTDSLTSSEITKSELLLSLLKVIKLLKF